MLLTLMGCHTAFKKQLPNVQVVNAQAFTTTAPHVTLGNLYEDDLISRTVNTYQGIQRSRAEQRIREGLRPDGVATALVASFGDALGSGPPFSYSSASSAPATIQMEIQSYGMEVPYIGAQGIFEFQIRVRGYLANGQAFYRSRVSCSNAGGAPRDVSVAFGTVNNVHQLEVMSDAEIQAAFDKVAEWCGWEVVRKMRRHAG